MKFRCAYCRKEFGPAPASRCPHCGKTMMIPDEFLPTDRRARERAKERIRRDAERERMKLFLPDTRFGRTPKAILLAVAVLIVVGGFLVKQTERGGDSTQAHTGRIMTARRNVDTLRIALERFRRDCGRYPTMEEGLEALVTSPDLPGRIPGWKRYVVWVGPDPWGEVYRYTMTGGVGVAYSSGPDRQPATGDDIVGREPSPENVNKDRVLGRVAIAGITDTATNEAATAEEPDEHEDEDEDEPTLLRVPVRILTRPPAE